MMKRILFIGDSITDQNFYPVIVESLLLINDYNIDFYNIGLTSETVCGLTEEGSKYKRPNVNERIERALEEIKPEAVFVFYGVNDGIYKPFSEERYRCFKEGYLQLIEKLNRFKVEINLLTTVFFDSESCTNSMYIDDDTTGELYGNYDEVMFIYSEYIKNELSRKINGKVIDIHGAMKDFVGFKRKQGKYVSGDGIHPNFEMNFVIANEIIKTYFNKDCKDKLNDETFLKVYKAIKTARDLKHFYYKEKIGHNFHAKSIKPPRFYKNIVEKISLIKLKRIFKVKNIF